jgi:hypothetical protein
MLLPESDFPGARVKPAQLERSKIETQVALP